MITTRRTVPFVNNHFTEIVLITVLFAASFSSTPYSHARSLIMRRTEPDRSTVH